MAKRADIIEQAPDFMKLSLLDLIMLMDPSKTNKYTPLLIKLLTKNYNKRQIRRDDDVEEFNRALRDEYNIVFNNIPTENVPMLFHLVGVFSSDFVGSIMRFLDAAEKKQIPGLDITTINEISQISELMSLIQLKNISKKLQKQALKDYEDDEWLIVRPFTAEASQKYGYGTKWCTASESYQGHFFRYTEDGKLVYCINKINGKKVAIFYKNHQDKETELSFWDMTDDRVDSMLCELPNPIMDIIKNILFVKDSFTNKQLNEQAWLTSHSIYRELEKKSEEFIGEVAVPQEARAVRLERQGVTMEEEFSEDAINTADGDW
jgi:hypothetical protein